MKHLNELTGLYSLSKTLRFELKPIGKTLEHIQQKGLITQDEQRAEEYKQMKDIIDEYHKKVISQCLGGLQLDLEDLQQYVDLVGASSRDEEALDDVKAALRKQIADAFAHNAAYQDLFKKELITKHLPEFVKGKSEHEALVAHFEKFTSYFTGYYENRRNMYTPEAKSTSIAYRIVHENLPVFLDNIKSFGKIGESEVSARFAEIESAFAEYLNVAHLAEMFRLDYFSDTLTQEQIAVYNSIIGGRTLDDGTKLQGINEYVNLYNQQHKDVRLPLLKPLYKMILSDRVALSWLPEEFTADAEMAKAVNAAHAQLKETLANLRDLLLHIDAYDMEHIYIANDLGLTDMAQRIFGQYDAYASAIKQKLCNDNPEKPKEKRDPQLYDERIDKLFKAAKSYSIAYLNSFADASHSIDGYFRNLGAYERDGEQHINHFAQIEAAYTAASDVLSEKNCTSNHIGQSDADTALVKNLLDAYKALQHYVKPLLGNGDEPDKDNAFYAKLREAWDALDAVTPLYNKVRNWLTRKPYSTEKVKLNFEIGGAFLSGWVDSKTEKSDNGTQYGGYLFRKKNAIGEYDFYLGISADKKLFRRDDGLRCEDGMFERLDYYQLKSQTIFGSSYAGNYGEDSNQLLSAFREAIVTLHINVPGTERSVYVAVGRK